MKSNIAFLQHPKKWMFFSGSQYLHENTPHIKSVLLAGPENSGKTMLVSNNFFFLQSSISKYSNTSWNCHYSEKQKRQCDELAFLTSCFALGECHLHRIGRDPLRLDGHEHRRQISGQIRPQHAPSSRHQSFQVLIIYGTVVGSLGMINIF